MAISTSYCPGELEDNGVSDVEAEVGSESDRGEESIEKEAEEIGNLEDAEQGGGERDRHAGRSGRIRVPTKTFTYNELGVPWVVELPPVNSAMSNGPFCFVRPDQTSTDGYITNRQATGLDCVASGHGYGVHVIN